MRAIDWSGLRFGELTAVRRVNAPGRHPKWLWLCECGNERIAAVDKVKAGRVVSCGCLTKSPRRHGHTYGSDGKQSRTYRAWANMKSRVAGATEQYKRTYADRGITVCPEWADSFDQFLSDMGECPPGMSLDREDNDGNYEPGNCRWATPVQQTVNRRVTRFVVYGGERLCLKDACQKAGVLYDTAIKRVTKGLSAQEALDRG